jgi:hypothetical protein
MVRQARAAAAAAKSDEAARMAGQALAMDPGNQEAKQILASLKAADLQHMKRADAALQPAKNAAVAAGAPELASALFAAAEKQEHDARDAGDRQQYAMAAARLEAATSLFATAEATARQQAEARARQKEIEASRRAAEQAAASAESPKPAAPAPAPPPPPAAPVAPAPAKSETLAVPDDSKLARDAALSVLKRYVSALEHRDIGALKALWPGLQGREQSAIESEFENARAVNVTFSNPKVEVTGTTATVSGLRQYALRTRDGQDLRSETLTTLALKRAGSDWVIESVRHQPAR